MFFAWEVIYFIKKYNGTVQNLLSVLQGTLHRSFETESWVGESACFGASGVHHAGIRHAKMNADFFVLSPAQPYMQHFLHVFVGRYILTGCNSYHTVAQRHYGKNGCNEMMRPEASPLFCFSVIFLKQT